MDSVSYLNPTELHSNPASPRRCRIPAGHDLIMIGGQNGVDGSGRVSPTTWLGWLGRRSSNLQICLKECECRS